MRLISQYRDFEGQTLQPEKRMLLATGESDIKQHRHWAGPFLSLDVSQHEIDEALKAWPNMRGLTEGEEPWTRLSAGDTDNWAKAQEWTDKQKEEYEARLRNEAGEHYIVVDPVKVAAPWPAYDLIKTHGQKKIEHVVKEILEIVQTTGVEAEAVVAYERQNANRQEVIDALSSTKEPEPDDSLIAA